jgi:hypothetical protein
LDAPHISKRSRKVGSDRAAEELDCFEFSHISFDVLVCSQRRRVVDLEKAMFENISLSAVSSRWPGFYWAMKPDGESRFPVESCV